MCLYKKTISAKQGGMDKAIYRVHTLKALNLFIKIEATPLHSKYCIFIELTITQSVLWLKHVIEIHINRFPVNELAMKRN